MNNKIVSYKELLKTERDVDYWYLLDKLTIKNGIRKFESGG